MKKLLPLILISAAATFCSIAQPSIQWQKCFGGTQLDKPNSIQLTVDGGYIVAGYTDSNDGDVTGFQGAFDFWIVKQNSSGVLQWQKCLGGTSMDIANSIQQTTDGGYIVTGSTQSTDGDVTGQHGYFDFWVIKLDSTGNLQWQKCFGGTDYDRANSIQQTTDGGFIVTGYAYSNDGDVTGNHGDFDVWVVKLDNSGNLQWQKCFGGTNDDEANSIQQTSDGGFILAGFTWSNDGDVTGQHGVNDIWVVKLDNAGNLQWQKCLGGTSGDEAHSIRQTADGGYIVAGFTASTDGDVTGQHGILDCWVVKLDTTGNLLWQKSLGGSDYDYAYFIQQSTDGGYVITGFTGSNDGDVTGFHGGYDVWVVKLDNGGNLQWQKCFGGIDFDRALSIQQTTDGGYIVAASALSTNGDVTCNIGENDFWIVKLSSVMGIEEINPTFSNLQISPNPVTQSTTISFSLSQSENLSVGIYDITGRLVTNLFDGRLNSGNHEIKWDVSGEDRIDDGVYLVYFTGDSFSNSSKMVVVK